MKWDLQAGSYNNELDFPLKSKIVIPLAYVPIAHLDACIMKGDPIDVIMDDDQHDFRQKSGFYVIVLSIEQIVRIAMQKLPTDECRPGLVWVMFITRKLWPDINHS